MGIWNADSFAYKLRQESGPLNPTGRITFIFDNEHSVFIHFDR